MLFNAAYFRALNANTSSVQISIFIGFLLFKLRGIAGRMKLITVAYSKPLTTTTGEGTVLYYSNSFFEKKNRFYKMLVPMDCADAQTEIYFVSGI